jgi:hypothetical protein
MSDTTSSLVQVLDEFVDEKIDTTKDITINSVLLYKAGSTLTPINLGKVSY